MNASEISDQIISPNVSRYKTPGTKNSQLQRRQVLLLALKERRHASLDEKRHISEVFDSTDNGKELEQYEEPMDVLPIQNKKRIKKLYANKLMLSEWLIEKPIDLEEKWLMKICPKGVRNLVVANKVSKFMYRNDKFDNPNGLKWSLVLHCEGKTKCFTKSGHFLAQFQSQLPGGSATTPMKFTILDCIFQKDSSTFYVLDVLVWNSYSVIQSSTEFRFFFIESKIEECVELEHICKGNEYKFISIGHKSSDIATIGETFASYMNDIDGVLFYHSDVDYLSKITPLVGWLKVFMLPEIFSIPVHANYHLEKPKTYINFFEYVQNFDMLERKRHRRKCKRTCDVEMAELESSIELEENMDESVMENE